MDDIIWQGLRSTAAGACSRWAPSASRVRCLMSRSFVLGSRQDDVGDHLPGWRGCIQAEVQRDQRPALARGAVHNLHTLCDRPTEAVELRYEKDAGVAAIENVERTLEFCLLKSRVTGPGFLANDAEQPDTQSRRRPSVALTSTARAATDVPW
jgi:hypothetical protein